ncbi:MULTISPECIES: YybH family protein [Streptomyces]|uniref:Nuclear transport factor 2 family protein n=1 Tax=Streptomyces arboris TaxID=2600619 RepID=A0A5N5EBI0_9ACTN|nr:MULTISPECIES: nuclear transport factor 2 family protein [Streptomyces]KAB2587557.1 nuclear transport factor 2 family protein [Streptomyces arboris]MDX3372976.1 nuclear transport factor 2 family protein [Streptomyces sp. ME02-6991-2A]
MAASTDALTAEVLEHAQNYVRAFNSHDPAILEQHYTEDAVTAWEKGKAISGKARQDELAEFLAQKPTMKINVLESYVTSDTALLVVDWTIDLAEAKEGPAHHAGIGLDVLRRGTDGIWRFAIDNPHGKDI